MSAIRRCQIELAKRKSLRDIEASKDAVETAWNKFNHATARYCMHAGGVLLSRKELDEQPEEARRAWYEWKALSNMMDEVVDKAEEYVEESATRENYCDDKDSGNDNNDVDDSKNTETTKRPTATISTVTKPIT